MKTTITPETVHDIARELAFAESSRYDAVAAGLRGPEEYWDAKGYGIKRACAVFLGCWPAVYYVPAREEFGCNYVVVDFMPSEDGAEYHIDADTFEFLEF